MCSYMEDPCDPAYLSLCMWKDSDEFQFTVSDLLVISGSKMNAHSSSDSQRENGESQTLLFDLRFSQVKLFQLLVKRTQLRQISAR